MSSVNSLTVNTAGLRMHESNHWAVHHPQGSLGLHRIAQFGGILGVTLGVNQHQRVPLVVLDDVRDAAEILQKQKPRMMMLE